jgi:lysophospholipid acyltransferase (LPLAT)-like uncharacterized protein
MRRLRWFSSKRLFRAPWLQKVIGIAGAEYLRLVWNTSRLTLEPPGVYDWIDAELPIIIAMWHGQHFMAPFIRHKHHRAKVLISRHRDGEINAIAAERLGVGTIRGSGSHGSYAQRKGGVPAFLAMLQALRDSYNVALTADVPKVARVVGRGIIVLARESGRPIYPVAMTTHRRIQLSTWDRSALNLPFSRCAVVLGKPVRVPPDADPEVMEAARMRLQTELESVTDRAHAIVASVGGEVPAEAARG